MGKNCQVNGCDISAQKIKTTGIKVSMHQFPTDEALRQCWKDNVFTFNRTPVNAKSFICEKHFERKWFHACGKLRYGAIPTIFPGSISNEANFDEDEPSTKKYKFVHNDPELINVESSDTDVQESNEANVDEDDRSTKKYKFVHNDPELINVESSDTDEQESLSPVPTSTRAILYRYPGDLKNVKFETSRSGNEYISVLKKNLVKKNKVVRCLQDKLIRRETQITNLKSLINNLRERHL